MLKTNLDIHNTNSQLPIELSVFLLDLTTLYEYTYVYPILLILCCKLSNLAEIRRIIVVDDICKKNSIDLTH